MSYKRRLLALAVLTTVCRATAMRRPIANFYASSRHRLRVRLIACGILLLYPIAGLLPVFRCVYIRIPQEIAACLPICCPCISRLGFVRGQFGHLSCLASCHGQSAACKAAAAWIGSEIHHPRGQGIGASPAARCGGSVGASSSKANSSSSTHASRRAPVRILCLRICPCVTLT